MASSVHRLFISKTEPSRNKSVQSAILGCFSYRKSSCKTYHPVLCKQKVAMHKT